MPDSYAINIITPAPTPITIGTAIGASATGHTHPASQISDSTAAGRALLTAANVAAQHAALGKLGAANMADALEGAGDPNNSLAVITGITDPLAANQTLIRAPDYGGYPCWTHSGAALDVAILDTTLAAVLYKIAEGVYAYAVYIESTLAYSAASDSTIDGFGEPGAGSGVATVTLQEPAATPSHLGQLYRDTVNNVWYRATSIDPPAWELDASGGGGGTDHGALTGLADDDHTQYHTDARGDARYAPLAHTHELDELAATGIAAGKVLTANGAAAATWETPSSSAWDGDIADINLDGGTDIGADLADADLILVDDGAVGTNRKSAISRLWTYIKGKIDAGQTWAGAHAFSSTTRPTSAGTGTPAATSLITKDDADARYAPERFLPVVAAPSTIPGAVTSSVVGGNGTWVIGFNGSPTAGSASAGYTAWMPMVATTAKSYNYHSGKGNPGLLDFAASWVFSCELLLPSITARDNIFRVAIGAASTSGGALHGFSVSPGYGLRINKKSGSSTLYQMRIFGQQSTACTVITGASSASPIVITQVNHNLQNGDQVEILQVGGNTAANGIWTVTRLTADTYSLDGSTWSGGAYTSGGTANKISAATEFTAGHLLPVFMTNLWIGSSATCVLRIGAKTNSVLLWLGGLCPSTNSVSGNGETLGFSVLNVSGALPWESYRLSSPAFHIFP